MNFTKQQMQDELKAFLVNFSSSMERMYFGTSDQGLMGRSDGQPEGTILWNTVSDMYDYGVLGINSGQRDLGSKMMMDATFIDVEMFLRGLDSLDPYLEETGTEVPTMAITATRTAVARHVLEGGDRYTWFEDVESNYLGFPEMALLANMDERSVRNAANPKHADPLKTVAIGKRTFVEPLEARRWLAQRKGFVPTQVVGSTAIVPTQSPTAILELPAATFDRIKERAAVTGLTPAELIEQLVS